MRGFYSSPIPVAKPFLGMCVDRHPSEERLVRFACPAGRSLCRVLSVAVITATASAAFAEDVPFVGTPEETVAAMLETAAVGPGDTVIDLGSGDGRIVISAVKDFGATRAVGIEINPRLVAAARGAAERAGVAARVEFRQQNLFAADFSGATVLTMYLLPDLNLRLRQKVLALAPGTRIVSHEFDMGDWRPDSTRTVLGDEDPRGPSVVHFWIVPAPVAGIWSWQEGGRELAIGVRQQYQRIEVASDAVAVVDATLAGDRIRIVTRPRSAGTGTATIYDGRVAGDRIEGTITVPESGAVAWRAARRRP
jgi:SAM-dependent methyltransferase